jgi:archaellum component FlaC
MSQEKQNNEEKMKTNTVEKNNMDAKVHTTEKEEYPVEDYLDEDKPLRHTVKKQNWCVISMLTPNCFPENKREQYKDQKILGLKFRGVYEEYEQASARAEQLQKIDKFHNVFVGEIGKWLPFDVDVSNMGSEDQIYREKSLNKYMKSYKESLHDEEIDEKQRKTELLQGANVVTGKHNMPDNCENVNVTTSDVDKNTNTDTLNSEKNHVKNSNDNVENIDKEIEKNKIEKENLKKQLETTKNSLEGLEDKLSTINELYAKLKSS